MQTLKMIRTASVTAIALWVAVGCGPARGPASQADADGASDGAGAEAVFPPLPKIEEMSDPLPSWNDGPLKERIWTFVRNASVDGSPGFIPEEARIAVFDNDGTLWSEKPMYFQMFFAMDRVRTLAVDHPEWKTTQPFKAVIENDMNALGKMKLAGGGKIVDASHAGITPEVFEDAVKQWFKTAVHPERKVPYTALVYQPMLELIALLKDRGFKVYIVSGGGVDFMRAVLADVYGIPPENVIGSVGNTAEVETKDGKAVVKTPGIAFVNDKEGKVVSIEKIIGRRPAMAFGNSDGDLAMLEYTAQGGSKTFVGLVHHTDAEREWAYDKDSKVGMLDKALTEAQEKGWAVVDMKTDWKVVYPN